MSVLVR